MPHDLFDPFLFQQTLHDDLTTKPSCQASYQASYSTWMQPIVNREQYSRFYYQLHKNVDEQMMTVYQTLLGSRFRDNTIVIFTSDHGDLLGSHADMHQKWYTAYDEAIRVPLIVWNPALFPQPRSVDTLTSHVDLLPTMLGLAGLDADGLRRKLAEDHGEARPPPGLPGTHGVEDVVLIELGVPDPGKETQIVPFQRTEKHLPLPEEHEMYNVTLDPMELDNLAGRPEFADTEGALAALLDEQCAQKRLRPTSGEVPGQPTCAQ